MHKTIAFSALAALCGTGCGSKTDDSGKATTAPLVKEGQAGGPVTLNASGSTFQKAYQEAAIEAFTKANPSVKINYGGGGSGKGRQDLADQVVDFAGADS